MLHVQSAQKSITNSACCYLVLSQGIRLWLAPLHLQQHDKDAVCACTHQCLLSLSAGLPTNDSTAEAADHAAAWQLPAGAGAPPGTVAALVSVHEPGTSK